MQNKLSALKSIQNRFKENEKKIMYEARIFFKNKNNFYEDDLSMVKLLLWFAVGRDWNWMKIYLGLCSSPSKGLRTCKCQTCQVWRKNHQKLENHMQYHLDPSIMTILQDDFSLVSYITTKNKVQYVNVWEERGTHKICMSNLFFEMPF